MLAFSRRRRRARDVRAPPLMLNMPLAARYADARLRRWQRFITRASFDHARCPKRYLFASRKRHDADKSYLTQAMLIRAQRLHDNETPRHDNFFAVAPYAQRAPAPPASVTSFFAQHAARDGDQRAPRLMRMPCFSRAADDAPMPAPPGDGATCHAAIATLLFARHTALTHAVLPARHAVSTIRDRWRFRARR